MAVELTAVIARQGPGTLTCCHHEPKLMSRKRKEKVVHQLISHVIVHLRIVDSLLAAGDHNVLAGGEDNCLAGKDEDLHAPVSHSQGVIIRMVTAFAK